MAGSKRLFGTNGVRGIAGVDMTPDLVVRIGAAFGSMRTGRIAVGRDTRTSGEMLLHAVKAGLLSAGCHVADCGILPTPALQYIVKEEFDGGAMITASHNPPEYNGVKIIEADGTEMGDEETFELEQRILVHPVPFQSWENAGCTWREPHLIDRYVNAIVSQFPEKPGKGMVVAVDPGSGPACKTTPEILRRLGCRVLTINGTLDGTFPGRLPEPSKEGLTGLSNLVVTTGAAFGVAHDGDADRAVFVDENGMFVEENQEFALITRNICRAQKGIIVVPVSTSRVVEEIAKDEGCSIHYTKVGSINVARTMHALIEEGSPVIFGGEGNGGLIYPHHQLCRDGGMTAATMVAILAEGKIPLSGLVAQLPQRFLIKDKVRSEKAHSVIEHLNQTFESDAIDRLDGIRISRGESWALIRASGTEPLVRIIVESDTEEKASEFFNGIMGEINRVKDKS